MRTTTRTLSLAVTATALALTLAACGAEVPASTGTDATPSQAAQPDEPLETPSPEPEPEDAGPALLTWGETLTYEDDLAIAVSQPTGYAPTEWAAGVEGFTSFVTFNVTVTNGTDAAYEWFNLDVAVSSGGAPASEVFDYSSNIGSAPEADLLPGQSVTYAVAYGVANTADLTVDASAGYTADLSAEYQHGYWQGGAA